ncbi:arabinose efflux permease family protein [Paenibacillus algicola]|uniref:Arabinose efflux permease family protein n=1 Tax=Paenibacillus algicola TaxID=2565926 RepID=A0A4P8XRA9_9BACL|nr:MFS transporter [Paenibacillus algicola]QCT04331.1 arabinose efflux permease family protein [Paenibacillus algicola]
MEVEIQQGNSSIHPARTVWGDRNFLKLWTGQSLSMFGSQITAMALPLIAALSLKSSPLQMGILHAVEYAPFLLFGLVAGVWVDRLPKRPLLIAADFSRAALLMSIPILAWVGLLNFFYVCLVAFVVGVCTTFYSIGYQSILPYMLRKDLLVDANAKMELSRSAAGVTGPGLSGLLVQWLSGAVAIVLDAFSFLISGLLTCRVQVDEPPRQVKPSLLSGLSREIGEGMRLVFQNHYLRSIAACSATFNFFYNMILAVIIVYTTRTLGFSPAEIGLVMTLGSLGAVLSVVFSGRLVARFGLGPVIAGSALGQGLGFLFLFGAAGTKTAAFLMILLSMFIVSLTTTVYNVAQISFRQSITAPDMLGRMNATMRFVVWGVIPLGALSGGALGTWIGLYETICAAACGGALSFLWIWSSPVRTVQEGKQGEAAKDEP